MPVRDGRVFTVTDIPYVDGEPDYRHAKGRFSGTVAIPPSGVRAIDAVLRSLRGGASGCGCEVMFNQPSRTTDWVWTIPLAGTNGVRKYAVDARTLKVSALGS